MAQTPSSLTPDQETLQTVAIEQLQAALTTLEKLQGITTDQGDVEALQDAQGSVAAAQGLLRDWFGKEPD